MTTPDVMGFNQLCANCGLTFGSHRGDSQGPDECPRQEGRTDFIAGSRFEPSDVYENLESGTPADSRRVPILREKG